MANLKFLLFSAIEWIKKKLSSKSDKISIELQEELTLSRKWEGKMEKYNRFALVQAHTDSRPGCSTYNVIFEPLTGAKAAQIREYDFSGWVCKEVKRLIDLSQISAAAKIFKRDEIGRLGVGKQIKAWSADVVISFHLNSIGSVEVKKYREILVLEKHKGTRIEDEARLLLSHINKAFPIQGWELRADEGIKWIRPGDRGYKNLTFYEIGGAACFLLEPDFVGYPSISNAALLSGMGPYHYAKAVADYLLGKPLGIQ